MQNEVKETEAVSVIDGQWEDPESPVSEPSAPAERGEVFEAENEVKNEVVLEPIKGSTVAPEVQAELEKMIEESGPEQAPSEPDWPTHCAHGVPLNHPAHYCYQCAEADMGNPFAKASLHNVQGDFGPQPDGSLAVRVIIDEPHVTIVRDSATDMEQTPDQWVTERFREWLEAYYTVPGKR